MANICFALLLAVLASVQAKDPDLIVENGQLTFDAEGNDNPKSAYFSRKLHVPSAWSGITVGRGYDIKYKSYKTVLKDLTKVGVDGKIAKKIAGGVGKRGKRAKKYIKDKNLQSWVIGRRQQKDLFKITFRAEARVARYLVNKYYKIQWNPLKKKIKEILVDLKYRGDFRPTRHTEAMKQLKAAVKKNSIADLKTVMGSRKLWRNVPYDRFKRRKNYLK